MRSVEIVEIGDGLGVILPSEILPLVKDAQDGNLFLTETENGITLTTVDPNTAPVDFSQ
jgi:hypothetical protein